ncbi:hypothetical protein PISMIDRAFT_682423 [Pisolithus microcarpus 441]|uniref:Unplaced genomic scaffold scaffold_85, whole genome shotgun sequence n=1 Tax=Pisolithus microcarpus 441 TaxID=765257 RepID=A0A0C9ZJW9_9AGAM|nr:hypothetical protein PISMIDRAFT_682423 [Pisolithus microcarpus 441]
MPFVQIGAVVAEEFEFLWVEVFQAGFANISGQGTRIHSIPFPTSSLHSPSPSPRVSSDRVRPLSFGMLLCYSHLLAPSSSHCRFATEDSCILK